MNRFRIYISSTLSVNQISINVLPLGKYMVWMTFVLIGWEHINTPCCFSFFFVINEQVLKNMTFSTNKIVFKSSWMAATISWSCGLVCFFSFIHSWMNEITMNRAAPCKLSCCCDTGLPSFLFEAGLNITLLSTFSTGVRWIPLKCKVFKVWRARQCGGCWSKLTFPVFAATFWFCSFKAQLSCCCVYLHAADTALPMGPVKVLSFIAL